MILLAPMKSRLTLFLPALTSAVLAGAAEPAANPAPALPPHEAGKMPELKMPPLQLEGIAGTVESRCETLPGQAGLDAKQQEKLKAILSKHDPAIQQAKTAWRASSSTEDRKKLSALLRAQNDEVAALLTEEQKTRSLTAQYAVPERPQSPGGDGAAGPGGPPPLPSVPAASGSPVVPRPAAKPTPPPASK
jgi:hypothetical protein